MRIFFPNQSAPLQNPVDGGQRHRRVFFPQQHVDLFRAPTELAAQCFHALFLLSRRPQRTVRWASAAFHNSRDALSLRESSPPAIPRRPRNPKLTTQRGHFFLAARRPHYKLHSLLAHIRPRPWHRPEPPGSRLYPTQV